MDIPPNSPKYTRRSFISRVGLSAAGLALAPHLLADDSKPSRPNVLLITVDDMNWDSLGVTGCKIPGITPNIDELAGQGIRFEHAHVTCAVCQPSRSAIFTGRYPHRNGAMGFEPIKPRTPTLSAILKDAGYTTGIMAKVGHLAPQQAFKWDVVVGAGDLQAGRNPKLYYKHSKAFFEQAKASGKPFFLMANAQDPHRPFPRSEQQADYEKAEGQYPGATKYYKGSEVPVPPFLPKGITDIEKEVAQYFTAVHRCDETVGQVLRALKESGLEDNTMVIFLSDNGMSFPFAKTNCYECSTKTPLIVRWPGNIKPGVNQNDFVSGVDFMPTILEAVGLEQVKDMDGKSFLPLLKGKKQEGLDRVFTFFTKTAGKNDYPMRCIRTKDHSYIYNPWSDGKYDFRNEPQAGLTFKAMKAAAENDEKIAARVKHFLYRVPEEFYDLNADPNETKNLIDDPKHKAEIDKLRAQMLKMMESTQDPLLEGFKKKIVRS